LIGKSDDGTLIKEYEASHGTVSDMWLAHLRGEPTSLNPLGLVEALIGAMQHAAALDPTCDEEAVVKFTNRIRSTIHKAMVAGKGTQDICGASGLTTEAFVDLVGGILDGSTPLTALARKKEKVRPSMEQSIGAIDQASVMKMFKDLDEDGNGVIDFEEFAKGLIRLGVQPKKFGFTA
jgi:isocitrate dehydrogenase